MRDERRPIVMSGGGEEPIGMSGGGEEAYFTDELPLFYVNRHKTSLANICMCLRVYFHECIC